MADQLFISNIQGYSIYYSPAERVFVVQDGAIEVGRKATQDIAEDLAKRLSKTSKAFPLPVLVVRGLDLHPAKMTSYDLQTHTGWLTITVGENTIQRQKISILGPPTCFHATPENQQIAAEYADLVTQYNEIIKAKSTLLKRLTEPVTDEAVEDLITKAKGDSNGS